MAAIVALLCVLVFMFGSLLREFDKRREADRKRDEAIEALQKTNEGIVGKLTEVFIKVAAAEEAAKAAGTVPTQTVEQVVESLKGYVDPRLITRAIEAARRGPQGPQGPAGPPGPQGAAASSPATSSTSTSTATTTTTRFTPPTTTTTRRCVVTVPVLGLKVGC